MFRTAPLFVPGSQPQRRGFGRTGGSPFDPSNYGVVVADLNASTLVLSQGDPVDPWTSFASAAGNTPPVYQSAALNGLPAVRFDEGGTTRLVFTGAGTYTALYLFMVWKTGYVTSGGPQPWENGDIYYPYLDGNIYERFGSSIRRDALVPAVTMTNPHIYSIEASNSIWSAYQNGNQLFTTATNTFSFSVAGGIGNGGTISPYSVDVGRMILYDISSTPVSNPTAVLNAVAGIYGITL